MSTLSRVIATVVVGGLAAGGAYFYQNRPVDKDAAKARSRCRAGDPRQYSCFCDGLVGADAGVLDHFAVADHF